MFGEWKSVNYSNIEKKKTKEKRGTYAGIPLFIVSTEGKRRKTHSSSFSSTRRGEGRVGMAEPR